MGRVHHAQTRGFRIIGGGPVPARRAPGGGGALAPRRRSRSGCGRLLAPVFALLALFGTLPAATPAGAFPEPPFLGPPDGFSAARTGDVRFLVATGAPLDAAAFAVAYGGGAERAYDELTILFPPLEGTVDVYAYADEGAFGEAIAATTRVVPPETEVVATPGVGDVAVALPRFLARARSPLEAENALRHAVAQVLVRHASDDRLPRGFDEGIALYVERPVNARLARYAALLQNALQRDDLLSWSDLNRPQPANADPALVAAHAYGLVAFLVERHGLSLLRDFVAALPAEPDWRTAMREVYKRSPSELEEQWRENLPRWTAGGWRDNLFAAFDLQPARDLLAKAHYAAAKTELEHSLRLYTDLGDVARQAEVEGLLRQGNVGLQAEALMSQTQEALERHTYDRAQTLLGQAHAQYDQLPPEQRPTEVLAVYDDLAATGLTAGADLEAARRLSRRWADYLEARAAAVDAGSAFARLGDEEMTGRAQVVLDDLDTRQRRLVLMLGALAALSIAWLALWLWARGPAELNWQR